MRSYSLLFFLAACASKSPAPTNPPSDPAGQPISLTCSTSVTDYCASNSCDQSLAAAEQDKNLCPATLARCGEYQVVVKGSIDVITRWYYRSGNLVAITSEVVPGRYTCLAGSGTFNAPHCADSGQTLPACSP
jgi:hypothetical protein